MFPYLADRIEKVVVALASMFLVGLGLVAIAPPATAASYLYHKSPDDGYSAPFKIACSVPNQQFYLYPGAGSQTYCDSQYGLSVYVNAGTQIACQGGYGTWYVAFDATGWHDVPNNQSMLCVYQLD